MSTKRWLWITLALQLLFFAAWAGHEEWRRHSPAAQTGILLETRPVDPRDILSGQYMDLNLKIHSLKGLPGWELREKASTVWVKLEPAALPEGRIVHRATQVSLSRGGEGLWAKASLRAGRDPIYGIERYYFNEARQHDPDLPKSGRALAEVTLAPDGQLRLVKLFEP